MQCLVWFSVGTGLLVGNLHYSLPKNVVFLILGGILNFLFTIVEIKDRRIEKLKMEIHSRSDEEVDSDNDEKDDD